jgi:hypothetical protein
MDEEWDKYPHVIATSENDWRSSCMDHQHDIEEWYDAMEVHEPAPDDDHPFDVYGNYRHRFQVNAASFLQRSNDTESMEYAVDLAVMHHTLQQYNDLAVSTNFYDMPELCEYVPILGDDNEDDDDFGDNFNPTTSNSTSVNYREVINAYLIEQLIDRGANGGTAVANLEETPPAEAEAPQVEEDPRGATHDAFNVEADVAEDHADPDAPPEPPPGAVETIPRDPHYEKMRPLFGWLSVDRIKETFKRTTQLARMPSGTTLKRAFKSSNPYFNVLRRHEAVACDIIYADEPAVDNGSKSAVIFVGRDTNVVDAYGIKSDKEFVNTLEDNIRDRGAPDKLISDRAQVEISSKVKDILRALFISAWQSEPHQQQQNYAERMIQTVKTTVNHIMDRVGAPVFVWLLCLQYVCFLLNHTHNSTVKGIPLQHLTGQTIDISPLLRFYFWQQVYYLREGHSFPDTPEGYGRIVGISEHVGPIMTYMILNEQTLKVIYRSNVRPHSDDDPNLRAALIDGENSDDTPTQNFVRSRSELMANGETGNGENINVSDSEDFATPQPIAEIDELIGRSFLTEPAEDGTRSRATIIKAVDDLQADLERDPERRKFICSIGKEEAEEVFTYNQVLEHLENDKDFVWKFKRIVGHQGPLTRRDKDYQGSQWNVMVEWENGEITEEPLSVIASDDPVCCAVYAREKNLLELPGWKRFSKLARREKKLLRTVNQAKLRSWRNAIKYQNGYQVPNNYADAVRLDQRNGNTKWQDATVLEMTQLDDYDTFKDIGHADEADAPSGYQKIRGHLVYAVKHDGRHKARYVADGHLTPVPVASVYSGVVSLRGLRMVMFLAELNGLPLWSTDIGNAYLEAKTSERVYIVAGDEFGPERKGHILIVVKALYGLRRSGQTWAERFAGVLTELGFKPCKAEPDIWMRDAGDVYEYVAVYVDDLAFALKDPEAFVKSLEETYNFKLKGTGPISFHLGMEIFRDEDGTLCISPRKYIEKMLATYEREFGSKPTQNVHSPLEKGDHPELDDSELLPLDGITQYQSLVGSMQWAVSIGRLDIQTAVMTMSSFRAAPRKGHLDRVKRIYGYLAKFKDSAIRIRTEEPDYSDLPNVEYDWAHSVYGDAKEVVPEDAPPPKGKYVTSTSYVDANLMHDIATGKSVTGILHFLNKTPIDSYSKKQGTVETATYGSEFVASRTCVEQIIDQRNTLRYLGVPIREKTIMFGDNQSVVNSSMQVHARLHKRHGMLSFHRVREAIASGFVGYYHIPGSLNPADILSKHWGHAQIWPMLKPLMFWRGDTANC